LDGTRVGLRDVVVVVGDRTVGGCCTTGGDTIGRWTGTTTGTGIGTDNGVRIGRFTGTDIGDARGGTGALLLLLDGAIVGWILGPSSPPFNSIVHNDNNNFHNLAKNAIL
jgi:hypothetical protein